MLACLAPFLVLAGAGCGATPPSSPMVGQWIWSDRDRSIFDDTREQLPDLVPGVWVSTISFQHGAIVQRLALRPSLVANTDPAIVIRFDDSFTEAWSDLTDEAVGARLDERLDTLLQVVERAGVTPAEVQLDYDVPIRLLPRWAAAVGMLAVGALADQEVWITSLVAHVRQPDYGRLFRSAVRGHVVQVFDTGDVMDPVDVDRLVRLAGGHKLPFRIGLGAFERVIATDTITAHRAWFVAVPRMAMSKWYGGVWVFPGGEPWVAYLEADS